ncbi:kyphoscoliosis peptidase-like [Orbicella faveolata]|uniref:kyphoscoliosis peptidase-like n=1 Tax=Orbicella faveolata TaxID=48498 RepID=UPI0009E5B2EE|nr:kyphoscoliosis peptidase-like [Orbicella faveolata]XP_020620638.1 kyphoscoliosis peptidase-like [Orbicella faveolata]
MGCGSSKSVETAVVVTNVDHNKPVVRDTNDNVDSKPTPLEDKPRIIAHEANLTESSEKKFSLGDRVHVSGYTGSVKFIGSLDNFGDGEWIGIELDRRHPQGNDGVFHGVRYFTCKAQRGMFARASTVFPHTDVDAINEAASISPRTIAFIQTSMRRYLARIRLARFQQRTGIEKQIDAHVLSTPEEKTESVEVLSEYLTSPWQGDRNKAYAIFRWLSFNVAYDVDGFFGRAEKKSNDAASVLRHKTSVCAGYASLFEALGKVAGLQVHSIEGYAKGYGFEPGQRIKDQNHAWNGVQVNGEWFISEPTWGAGYLGADLMFHRSPDVAMFLMDPEYAICSHYPADEQWQLLDKPISKEEFERLVVPSGRIHQMGIEVLSHKESIYDISDADNIEMMFYSPSLKILRGDLKNLSCKEHEGRKWTQVLPSGLNQVKLKAQFPAPGKYKLNLYVRDEVSANKWHHGVEYVIHTNKGVAEKRGGFPQLGSEFYEAGFHLDHPLENIVSQDGTACISLHNYNSQISRISGQLELEGKNKSLKKEFQGFSFCYSEKTNNGFQVKVHCPLAGEYTLKIFAKHFDEDHSDTYVCTYYINALYGVGPIPGFPRMSDTFVSWGLELKEPRENIYVPDGRASVQLKIPDDVSVVGSLAEGNHNLDNSLCFAKAAEDGVSTILVHTPEAGVFQLNIFGKKTGSKETEYLATFMIKSELAASPNPGFPYLKDEFKDWGLELVDQVENIVSRDSHVSVTFNNPNNISIKSWLFDEHNKQIGNSCPVETADHKTTTTCQLPDTGKFKLNVFGTNLSIDSTKQVFLCTYKVLYTS